MVNVRDDDTNGQRGLLPREDKPVAPVSPEEEEKKGEMEASDPVNRVAQANIDPRIGRRTGKLIE